MYLLLQVSGSQNPPETISCRLFWNGGGEEECPLEGCGLHASVLHINVTSLTAYAVNIIAFLKNSRLD